MDKESPINARMALTLVEHMKTAGIPFVPMPVKSEEHRVQLLEEAKATMASMAMQAAIDEANEKMQGESE